MPIRASAGLPSVSPALPLYELRRERPASPVTPDVAGNVGAWLDSLSGLARDLLISGIRLPREAVGYEVLSSRRDARRGLTRSGAAGCHGDRVDAGCQTDHGESDRYHEGATFKASEPVLVWQATTGCAPMRTSAVAGLSDRSHQS